MTQTIDNAATALLAERDGIHPAHAANRLDLAVRVANVLIASTNGDRTPIWTRSDTLDDLIERGNLDSPIGGAVRAIVAGRLLRDTISLDTWALAALIVRAADQ